MPATVGSTCNITRDFKPQLCPLPIIISIMRPFGKKVLPGRSRLFHKGEHPPRPSRSPLSGPLTHLVTYITATCRSPSANVPASFFHGNTLAGPRDGRPRRAGHVRAKAVISEQSAWGGDPLRARVGRGSSSFLHTVSRGLKIAVCCFLLCCYLYRVVLPVSLPELVLFPVWLPELWIKDIGFGSQRLQPLLVITRILLEVGQSHLWDIPSRC
jgi:hypothetical protein